MSVKMSGLKMSEEFDLEPGSLIGFLPYWSDKKCIYASAAIRSYDSNQELIAYLSKTANDAADHALRVAVKYDDAASKILEQSQQISDLNEMISQRGIDNTMLRFKAKKQQADIELLREAGNKLISAIAKHSCRDDRDDLAVGIEYIECECDELEQALAATRGEEG